MFHFVANTLMSAAQDVATELNKSTVSIPRKKICFFNDRLVLCGLPALRGNNPNVKDLHPLRSMQPFDGGPEDLRESLMKHFPNEGMVFYVWNLSGIAWDAPFCEIIEYDFPSRPIPPLLALVEIAKAMHQFLQASPQHVAICHDLSGRRSAVVAACVLYLQDLEDSRALERVCREMGNAGNELVATQRRYFDYFVKQQQQRQQLETVMVVALKRIIVNGIPMFPLSKQSAVTCEPYFRIYDARGKELGSSTPQMVQQSDASFSMVPKTSNVPLQGDVLVRVFTRNEVAMFAFGFHTNYLMVDKESGGGVLRLALEDLDGTLHSKRFPKDTFVDLVFGRAVEGFEPKREEAVEVNDEASLWKEIDDALQEGGGVVDDDGDLNDEDLEDLLDDD